MACLCKDAATPGGACHANPVCMSLKSTYPALGSSSTPVHHSAAQPETHGIPAQSQVRPALHIGKFRRALSGCVEEGVQMRQGQFPPRQFLQNTHAR